MPTLRSVTISRLTVGEKATHRWRIKGNLELPRPRSPRCVQKKMRNNACRTTSFRLIRVELSCLWYLSKYPFSSHYRRWRCSP